MKSAKRRASSSVSGVGAAQQHQPVRLEGLAEGGVDVLVRVLDESQPAVEMQPPDRDLIDGGSISRMTRRSRQKVPKTSDPRFCPAQRGADGQMLHVVPFVGVPVVEIPDKLVAAPDAFGPECGVGQGADVVLLGALLLVGNERR